MQLIKSISLTILQMSLFLPMLLVGGLGVLLLWLAIRLSVLYIPTQTLADFLTDVTNKK